MCRRDRFVIVTGEKKRLMGLSLLTKISDLSEFIWMASREQLVAPLLHAARETKRVGTDTRLDPRMSRGAQILDLK